MQILLILDNRFNRLLPSAGLAYNLLRHSRAARRLRGEDPMANEIWTIKRCLEWTKEYLPSAARNTPDFCRVAAVRSHGSGAH